MNRTQRRGIGALITFLVLAMVTTVAVFARGPELLPGRWAPAASDSGPFMGASDPAAPYDLRFLDEMIMHHQGAIASAQGMIANSSRPELRDLAQRIATTQQRQIDQMVAWRQQWYPNAPTPAMGNGGMMAGNGGMMAGNGGMMAGNGGMMAGNGGMMAGNSGMMGGGMMAGNGGTMGGGGTTATDQADQMFLRMMVPHHQLAIDMGKDALQRAQHEELKGLAREIIDGQSAEITEMEGYLKSWYGESSTRDLAGQMRDMMQRMMGGGKR